MNTPTPLRGPSSPAIGAEVRGLMRSRPVATLATVLADSQGWPYASLVLTAAATDGAPLLLLSRLAEHTKNIAADPRVSLLFDDPAAGPVRLANARATVQGRAVRSDDSDERGLFIARHPEAEAYAGFADFSLYRVEVGRAHLVAGFGRIHWVDAKDILLPLTAAAFGTGEADAVAALNCDGALVRRLTAKLPPGDWRITGCDPDGCDLRAGGATERIAFAAPISNAEDAAEALRRMPVGE